MVSGLCPSMNPRACRRSRYARESGLGVFLRGCAPFVSRGRGHIFAWGFAPAPAPRASAKRPQKRPPTFFLG